MRPRKWQGWRKETPGPAWKYFLGGMTGTPPKVWTDHLAAIDAG